MVDGQGHRSPTEVGAPAGLASQAACEPVTHHSGPDEGR